MERRHRSACTPQRGGDLDETARIAARVRVRPGGQHVRRLALAELPRSGGLEDVVDARTAAADLLLGRLEQRQAGNLGERRARLRLDALRVLQVARVLERDAELQPPALRARAPRPGRCSGGHSPLVHGGAICRSGANGPGAGSFRNASATRSRPRWGRTANTSARTSRSSGPRAWRSSTYARVDSIRRSYCTPEGHAVTHAMQPRQRSKCSTIVSLSDSVTSTRPLIR